MKKITVEGAQLAKEIGPTIFRKLKRNKFPLMFNILNTICKNKKLKQHLERNGKKRIMKKFRWEAVAQQYISVYERINKPAK